MSILKRKLLAKVNKIAGFEHITIDDISFQASRKITDIPRWFVGNYGCHDQAKDCAKKETVLEYNSYLGEFNIKE